MNNAVMTIFKKELTRFFGDRRLMISILMPGILIYTLYSFMGNAMGDMYSVDEDFVPTAYVVDLPESIATLTQAAGLEVYPIPAEQLPSMRDQVAAQVKDLVVVFPADFDSAVAAYSTTLGTPAPQVEIYYNSASTSSQTAYSTMFALLDAWETQMANKFDINAGTGNYDLASSFQG